VVVSALGAGFNLIISSGSHFRGEKQVVGLIVFVAVDIPQGTIIGAGKLVSSARILTALLYNDKRS
jgi:hypothetical protein